MPHSAGVRFRKVYMVIQSIGSATSVNIASLVYHIHTPRKYTVCTTMMKLKGVSVIDEHVSTGVDLLAKP